MASINIEINTFEEALNLQNVAAIKHNKILENPVKGQKANQALIGLMWKQIYIEAGKAMEELQTDEESCPVYLED